MPAIGLGLWKIEKSHTAQMVYDAIRIGYRHLDAACDYGNEAEAGIGIERALKDGICARQDLWVTSKLWNTYHRPEHVEPALRKSLSDLRLNYLDLYLVHFPIATQYVAPEVRYPPGWFYDDRATEPKMIPDNVPISHTWQAMEAMQQSGLVRNIGVCNFGCSLIRDLLSYAAVPPSVLQVESHPYLVQPKLLRFCKESGIAFTAFSPLGAGSYVGLGMATEQESVLRDPVVARIAAMHNKTAAQVVLRWGIQRGTAVIPKTGRIDRLAENLAALDFQLSPEEVESLSALDRNRRYNDPGVFCEAAFGCFFPIYE